MDCLVTSLGTQPGEAVLYSRLLRGFKMKPVTLVEIQSTHPIRDFFEPVAQIVIAFGLFASVVTLVFTVQTLKLQNKALYANAYDQMLDNVGNKLINMRLTENEWHLIVWASATLSGYERFAFYAKHEYLSPQMIQDFRSQVIYVCEDLAQSVPVLVVKEPKADEEAPYPNLSEFYEDTTGRPFPFKGLPKVKGPLKQAPGNPRFLDLENYLKIHRG